MPCNWRYKNKQGDDIMFWITQKEYEEIANLIMKYCCKCSPYACSEADYCGVIDILEILDKHVEREPINEEEEKLPFELDDDELL